MRIEILNRISLEINDLNYPLSAKNIFIADVTGRDSIAALIKTIEIYSPNFVIPSVIVLGCEFGNKDQPHKTIYKISEIYKNTQTQILPGILLDVNQFWKLFIAKEINSTVDKYKFFSPCIACHLIMHLARIKLAHYLKASNVISGEREFHADRQKINQLDFVLDFYNKIYSAAGINHHTPIRHIKENDKINEIVYKSGAVAIELDCLFSGTYYDGSGKITFDKNDIQDYVQTHLTSLMNSFSESIVINCIIL